MPLIKPLTSLRFFAAMMVLFHHFWGFEAGYAGVGFFFLLSGYVLAINYRHRVGTPAERRDFWFKRFARIYPTHLLTFVFALPLGWPLLDTLPSIPLLQSWLPFQGFQIVANAPSWSISDEVFFYALFPLIVAIPWRWLSVWAIGTILLALAWPSERLYYGFIFHGLFVRPTHFVFYVFPPVRLFEFALGVALASITVA